MVEIEGPGDPAGQLKPLFLTAKRLFGQQSILFRITRFRANRKLTCFNDPNCRIGLQRSVGLWTDMETDMAHLKACGMTFGDREFVDVGHVRTLYGYDPEDEASAAKPACLPRSLTDSRTLRLGTKTVWRL